MSDLSEEIINQCNELTLDPKRPLIISDADEVLLQFMVQFEHYLDTRDLWIDLQSFKLKGNIKYKNTDNPADVKMPDLLDSFFESETLNFQPVDEAVNSLTMLSQHAQIIILTNLPLAQRQQRIENLRNHGMDYPVIVGSGPKGPAVKWITANMTAPVFFLDDIFHNINSVADHAPKTHCIHMIADKRLRDMMGPADKASARIDDWPDAREWILQKIAL